MANDKAAAYSDATHKVPRVDCRNRVLAMFTQVWYMWIHWWPVCMIKRSRLCSSDLSHVGTSDTHLQIYMHVHAQREARNQELVGVSAQRKVLCPCNQKQRWQVAAFSTVQARCCRVCMLGLRIPVKFLFELPMFNDHEYMIFRWIFEVRRMNYHVIAIFTVCKQRISVHGSVGLPHQVLQTSSCLMGRYTPWNEQQ